TSLLTLYISRSICSLVLLTHILPSSHSSSFFFFFFNDTATTEIYTLSLHDALPICGGDADARLDLQEVLHRIYDAAGYAYYIYAGPPEPALSAPDAEWARQFLPVASQNGS